MDPQSIIEQSIFKRIIIENIIIESIKRLIIEIYKKVNYYRKLHFIESEFFYAAVCKDSILNLVLNAFSRGFHLLAPVPIPVKNTG